jgi:hypothetical protein
MVCVCGGGGGEEGGTQTGDVREDTDRQSENKEGFHNCPPPPPFSLKNKHVGLTHSGVPWPGNHDNRRTPFCPSPPDLKLTWQTRPVRARRQSARCCSRGLANRTCMAVFSLQGWEAGAKRGTAGSVGGVEAGPQYQVPDESTSGASSARPPSPPVPRPPPPLTSHGHLPPLPWFPPFPPSPPPVPHSLHLPRQQAQQVLQEGHGSCGLTPPPAGGQHMAGLMGRAGAYVEGGRSGRQGFG